MFCKIFALPTGRKNHIKVAVIQMVTSDAQIVRFLSIDPLITAKPTATVEEAAQTMFKNKIRRLPIVNESDVVTGIVMVTNLAMYLSPTRRPGLALSILQAISRGKKSKN
jgi:predicted transcriptional regulator